MNLRFAIKRLTKTVFMGMLVACGAANDNAAVFRAGDTSGIDELNQPLSALATAPAFAAGTLTITVAATEVAIIGKHPVSGNILVNNASPAGATATTVKAIAINGSSGNETIILDFANGAFATGTATAPGVTLTLGGGADVFKLRGSSTAADTVTLGGTATAALLSVNTDSNKDIVINTTGTVSYTFSLGDGADTFNATSGAYGTGGAAFTGDTTVYGGQGGDTLTGGAGNDTLYGDEGDDTLNGGSATTDSDVLSGGAGTKDTVTYASRSAGIVVTVGAGADDGDAGGNELDDVQADVEIVMGGSGNDTFTGTAGDQIFHGGAGNDTFLMGVYAATGTGGGNDTVYGEAGTDTVSYLDRLEAVVATMDGNVANDGASGETDNVQNDVENFVCPSAAVACTVTGNTLDNTITGGGGADILSGGAGDDTFVMDDNSTVGAGADQITGGAGLDTVDFSTFGAAVDVTMDFVASTTMGKKINTDVENVTCPSASDCAVVGNSLSNRVLGGSGDDTISLGAGDDTFETGGGTDTVDCGAGSDILLGSGATATNCEL